ncbi:MAG: type II and III secretion system protein family protein [Hyphomicrobiales bacterium]
MGKGIRLTWQAAAYLAAVIGFLAVLAAAPATTRAGSDHQSLLRIGEGHGVARRNVTVGLSKSMIVELPRDVRDVMVSDPKKLDAVVSTSRRVYLIGMEVGQANAFFFDSQGNQLLTLEVKIERDLSGISDMLRKLIPDSNIRLEAVNDNVILTGTVANPSDASRASDLAARLVGDKEKVLNMIASTAQEQVYLKVTVAEMERNTIKALGVQWDGNFSVGTGVLGFGSAPGFPLNTTLAAQQLMNIINPDGTANPNFNTTVGQNGIGAVMRGNGGTAVVNLKLLEQNGLSRTLAEPTLTAISGETANFLAGGEFPIPVAQDGDRISIEFKPFGVGLAFTPMVLSEGRISMKVSTEVSELSNEGAITLQQITIPALKVRRANTTIELPSGGSLVMAGLISDETRQAIQGQPGLKNLPVLGSLFRSRDFIKSETELVVIVTPYTVKPVARQELARPDKGFMPAGDVKATLMGHLNRIYGGRPDELPVGRYEGDYGFIIK